MNRKTDRECSNSSAYDENGNAIVRSKFKNTVFMIIFNKWHLHHPH